MVLVSVDMPPGYLELIADILCLVLFRGRGTPYAKGWGGPLRKQSKMTYIFNFLLLELNWNV